MCEQDCSNGGSCIAPNTCQCPPDWSGHDCTLPVCHQGFFVPFHELPKWMVEPTTKSHWLQYQPCNFSSWCHTTQGFDCAQADRESSPAIAPFGMDWRWVFNTKSIVCLLLHLVVSYAYHFISISHINRHKTGRIDEPESCMMLELGKDAVSHFQYVSALDNTSTPHYRYTPNLPYEWISNDRLVWNAFDSPESHITQPYKYQLDRQVALASYRNVTLGEYMCANGGRCVAPDVCSCAEGWMGFDCRVPVCKQGYYEPELKAFVKGVKSDEELASFEPFLDSKRTYDLDSSRNFSSNPDTSVWVERFVNESSVRRELIVVNGTRYLSGNESQAQGGYECSIRSVSQWEDYRSGYIFEHPNYYSRYMNEKVEDDGLIYSHWKNMNFPPTHFKTAKLVKSDHEFLHPWHGDNITKKYFIYTDVGYMKEGVWKVTGASWQKGHCVVEFERHCTNDSNDNLVPVQDTDEVSKHCFVLLCFLLYLSSANKRLIHKFILLVIPSNDYI